MKAIKKLLYFLAVAGTTMFASSCTEEMDYTPAPRPAGQQVYFATDMSETVNLEENSSSVTIPVYRVVADEAASFSIFATEESSLFSIPSTVDFAAGENSTNLVITYDYAKLTQDQMYPCTLTIGDTENTSPYGMSSYEFSFVAPAPWTSLGMGTYTEDVITAAYGIDNVSFEVEVQQSDSNKGLYRLKNLYRAGTGLFAIYNFADATGAASDYYITLDCSNPEAVTIAEQPLGFSMEGYGELKIFSNAPGTLANGVITFPKDGLSLNIPTLSNNYPTNASGKFKLVLPGAVDINPTVAVEFVGTYTSSDNTSSAIFKLTPNDDVASYKYAYFEGVASAAQVEEYVEGIINGTIESSEMESSGAEENLLVSIAKSGRYTLVVIPYGTAAGAAVAGTPTSLAFKYSAGGEEVPDAPAPELTLETIPAYEGYDEATSFFFRIKGANISAGKIYLNKTSVIEGSGIDIKDIINEYGEDLSDSEIEEIVSENGYENGYVKLETGTSYTIAVLVQNIDGVELIKTLEKTL